jgi:hypothetical protein
VIHDHSPTEDPVKDAKVEEMTEGWKQSLSLVLSSDTGFFLISSGQRHKLHYLRISAAGFNPVLIKVRVSFWARHRFLSISLPVAT